MALPPIIPWEPSNVPIEIQQELERRKRNIGMNYVKNQQSSWTGGDWQKYTGPMTAWVRMCSNGRGAGGIQGGDGEKHYPRERFVMFSGKDFQTTYGFHKTATSPNSQIVGYMPDGTPHIIDNEKTANYPIHVPAPEIAKVEMLIQKEILRRATVEWVCFSWKQLEYMTPYFLVPGITVMLEMGWNHFNPESLVDISKLDVMRKLWDNPYPLYQENIIKSKGNYDVIYGMITNFQWTIDGNNRYLCTTEITSKNRLYAGLAINSELLVKNKKGEETKVRTLGNLTEFLQTNDVVKNFRDMARQGPKRFFQASVPKFETKTEVITSPLGPPTRVLITKETNKGYPLSGDFLNQFFRDIYNQTLEIKDEERKQLKLSYLYGVFDGRSQKEYGQKADSADFDKGNHGNCWFSFGLITSLINVFSARASASDTTPMFELDIDDVRIGAHPNLVSADGKVLIIPNRGSPKFFYGKILGTEYKRTSHEYQTQAFVKGDAQSKKPADITLMTVMNQNAPTRDDIDIWINRNVYRVNPEASDPTEGTEDPNYKKPNVGSRSFPNAGIPEKNPCGYLRDIYVNISHFINMVNNEQGTYYDLVRKLVESLNMAVANFWNLQMTDNGGGKWTITDTNFVGSANTKNQNKVLIIDMHDANNIVKSFKFQPRLTDAQTMRVLNAETSNLDSQFYSKEEIESFDYEYRDSILYNTAASENKSYIARNQKYKEMWDGVLESLQRIDNDVEQTYQMKIPRNDPQYQSVLPAIPDQSPEAFPFLYIKLALPTNNGRSILKKLLDDQDYDRNPKYCAVQPGINAELTMQGIGGLRTFQCFLIKNLPAPYSHKHIIFQITNVTDHLEAGNWETTIVAGIRPLRNYIINALRLTPEDMS